MPDTPEKSWSEPLSTHQATIESPPDWQHISTDRFSQQQLKATLLQQVTELTTCNQPSLKALNASFVAKVINSNALSQTELKPLLEQVFEAQLAIYRQADISPRLRKRQFIQQSGLVLSPDYCVNTLKDTLRVGQFLKAINAAIASKLQQQSSVTIAYPACGPFAPLLIPLLSYYRERAIYSSEQLKISLIDIQPGAVQSLNALITAHNISEFIQQVACEDACTFRSDNLFDIIIVEAMQHGFSREAHLRITEHFATLLQHDGLLIPEQIIIEAWLTNAQQEYVEQWQASTAKPHQSSRTYIGEVMTINRSLATTMAPTVVDSHTQLLPCNCLQIPPLISEKPQTVILSSRLRLFQDLWLNEYESGITHPLPDLNICVNFTPKDAEPGDVLIKSGEHLKFYYCLNGLPGFFAAKDENLSIAEAAPCLHQ